MIPSWSLFGLDAAGTNRVVFLLKKQTTTPARSISTSPSTNLNRLNRGTARTLTPHGLAYGPYGRGARADPRRERSLTPEDPVRKD
jgi:hypothetical protein